VLGLSRRAIGSGRGAGGQPHAGCACHAAQKERKRNFVLRERRSRKGAQARCLFAPGKRRQTGRTHDGRGNRTAVGWFGGRERAAGRAADGLGW
jgi:hypothetical protein